MAGIFEIEVIQDWTHLQRSVSFKDLGADDCSQDFYAVSGELAPTGPVRFPSVFILVQALLLSLLLHSLLLLIGKPNLSTSFSAAPVQQKHSIHLVLNPSLVGHPNTVLEKPILEVVSPSQSESLLAPTPSISTPSNLAPRQLPKKRIIEAKPKASSAAPITAIRIQPLERDDLAAISAAPVDDGAATIFDPRLREKLRQQQAAHSSLPEPEVETWMDASGATWVKLPGGRCMSSPFEAKAGAVKNWYMRPCGGKSSSEKMIENMERDFHSRH